MFMCLMERIQIFGPQVGTDEEVLAEMRALDAEEEALEKRLREEQEDEDFSRKKLKGGKPIKLI